MGNIKLLLIEDNIGDIELTKIFFDEIEDLIINYESVRYLWEGLEKLKEEYYDIILVDLNLPDSSGLDTVKRILEIAEDIPIVVLTELDNYKLGIEAIKEGAQDYIVKNDLNSRLLYKTIQFAIERNKVKAMIQSLALKDKLTGLYNRNGFTNLTRKHIEIAQRFSKKLGITFIDVDNLKYINDNFGHKEGDTLIKSTAEILTATFRSSDIVARYGGDEFVAVYLCLDEKDNVIIRKRLEEAVEMFNNNHNYRWELSISIGMTYYNPKSDLKFEEMLIKADQSMYEEKLIKKNRIKQSI